MIHTLLLGRSLLDSLHLNLLNEEIISLNYPCGRGQPIWEIPPKRPLDGNEMKTYSQTYLARLVPMPRSIWLNSLQSMDLGNGIVYQSFEDIGFREPTATLIETKSELSLLSATISRSLWRDLAAICVKRSHNENHSGPLAFENTHSETDFRIWAGAMIFPAFNAKIGDIIESTYSLPGGLFTEFGRAAYERGVGLAEDRERTLAQAVKAYATTLKVDSPPYDSARQRYWTYVEQHLGNLFALARNHDLAADLEGSEWGQAVRAASLEAYNHTCHRQSPRQIQAYAEGLRRLTARKSSNPKSGKSPTNHE
jgi:hypothetical protein